MKQIDCSDKGACQLLLNEASQRGNNFTGEQFPTLNLPMIVKPLESQVGGLGKSKRRILTMPSSILGRESLTCDEQRHSVGFVLKPVREDHRGIREIAFYEQLLRLSALSKSRNDDDDEYNLEMSTSDMILNMFYDFIPMYYGVVQICKNSIADRYILLEDVTYPFQRPHVMDIKMGHQTWEPGESSFKIDTETTKYPMQHVYGFRITGMRIFTWDSLSQSWVIQTLDKQYGRSLQTRDELSRAFKVFFTTQHDSPMNHVNMEAIHTVLTQLYQVRQCFESNSDFGFFASSILIVVEGCSADCSNDTERMGPLAKVKMIDFGHVQRRMERDVGYLHGIATLCDILENIIRKSQETDNI